MDVSAVNPLSDPYWRGARDGRVVLQRCGTCGKVRHYPRLLCAACYSTDAVPLEARGTGTVHSWTVSHHAFDPSVAEEVPYALVTVDLDEGVRIIGRADPSVELRIGLPVRVTFTPNAAGVPIPLLVPLP